MVCAAGLLLTYSLSTAVTPAGGPKARGSVGGRTVWVQLGEDDDTPSAPKPAFDDSFQHPLGTSGVESCGWKAWWGTGGG